MDNELQYTQAKEFVHAKHEILDDIKITNGQKTGDYVIRINSHSKTTETIKRKYELSYQNFKQIKAELV